MPQSLEQRIFELEQLFTAFMKNHDLDMAIEQKDDARFMALLSIAGELAEKAGVNPDDFDRHYQTRVRWWHDYYLRRVEDLSQSRAAELDFRTPEQADVSETYPLLFDPPPPEGPKE